MAVADADIYSGEGSCADRLNPENHSGREAKSEEAIKRVDARLARFLDKDKPYRNGA
jgi:hypothetical protein